MVKTNVSLQSPVVSQNKKQKKREIEKVEKVEKCKCLTVQSAGAVALLFRGVIEPQEKEKENGAQGAKLLPEGCRGGILKT